MKDDRMTTLGMREIWGGVQPFALSSADRRRHLLILGKTGTGKSTLLKYLIMQDIHAGASVALIDPHGDLAEEILSLVPRTRSKEVTYFKPADLERPVGLNLLSSSTPDTRHIVTSGIVSAFKHIWSDSWGPRLEYLLAAGISALLECPAASLLALPRFLVDTGYRQRMLRFVTDPIVKSFWEAEYAHYEKRFRSEVIAPVQNKVGQLLMTAPLRNILGQAQSTVSIPFVMEQGRIFIANLSKGFLGEDKASLLGSLLITQFQLAALARGTIPEGRRRDCFLYVDEFQNVATNAFCSMLSEARKYRLNLTLSHQFAGQLRQDVREAVFGNVGSIVAFRTGASDAELLSQEFASAYPPKAFAELSNYEILVKALICGEAREPFRGRTIHQSEPRAGGRSEALIRLSRERFGSDRKMVEAKIQRWLNRRF
jgi:energy-coupling factor transporter ATP-binding protein EcfA2